MRNLLVRRPSGRVVATVAVCMVLALAGLVYSHKGSPPPPRAAANLANPADVPESMVPSAPLQARAQAPVSAEQRDVGRRLYREAAPRLARSRPAAEAITRVFPEVTVTIDDWQSFRPETLTVAVHPDLPLQFKMTALRDEGRYVTWVGRNAGLPGASFVGVATANGYDAIMVLPGASEFSIHIRGDEVVVAERNPADEWCGNAPVPQAERLPAVVGDLVKVVHAPGFVPSADTHAATAEQWVDVLFGYDATALAEASRESGDPVGYLDGQTKAKLETANLALAQSGITAFAWRYLGLLPVPEYTRTGKLEDDLGALVPSGGLYSWLAGKRYENGADQFMLLVGDQGTDYAGQAFSALQRIVRPEYAVSAMIWDMSFLTLAHELAHNFGCQHDRENGGEDNGPVPDGNGLWCYGHMWSLPAPYDYISAGTIMSYADWRIPYFSNPAISVQVTGNMLGWVGWAGSPPLGTYQIGRAESDPKAANNARVLTEQAAAISRLSQEITVPQITQQPVNATVNEGRWVQLGVSASGGGLTYQWFKEGAPVANATSSVFGKTSAPSDTGNYHVVVQNKLGSVTSATVSITVNRATTSNPSPPNGIGGGGSKGGGGGGGSVSGWFLGLLTLLSLGRCLQPERR